jgi:4-diphosphocytidyl-2-C-methyl-D-erythritol kinase
VAQIRELARAKVNLTLEVAGRRADGFHELRSLVTFANLGDEVVLDTSAPSSPHITVAGPFAADLQGENVLARALALVGEKAPHLARGSVHLEKQLPVAAGIGGGSADAGALLRALRRANGAASEAVDWDALALSLGADVAVCLASRPFWMTGVGEGLAEIPGGVPALDAVLVNPRVSVPADKTVQVYRALGTAGLEAGYAPPAPPTFAERADLLDFMRARGNDLTRAALAVVPETGAVLALLSVQPGAEYAAVSGGGPTCFCIFPDAAAAEAARARIAALRPDWWVAAVTLG